MDQTQINNFLSQLAVSWRCGRGVKNDGNCFYDSVLANIEHNDEIRNTISERAKNITDVRSLRSELLAFMETNHILHSCDPFILQQQTTLKDLGGISWEEYLAKMKINGEWADE